MRRKPAKPKHWRTEEVLESLIVRQGLSYVDAIDRCEQYAVGAAAPYREAAEILRADLERMDS